MPRLSILYIRVALFNLALGFTLGALLLLNKGLPVIPSVWLFLPAHIEFLLVGWIVQLAFGVAFWILPRFSSEAKRGNENLAWSSFILINLGIWLAGLGPILSNAAWISLVGRLSQALAALAFALHAWPRVKPFGR